VSFFVFFVFITSNRLRVSFDSKRQLENKNPYGNIKFNYFMINYYFFQNLLWYVFIKMENKSSNRANINEVSSQSSWKTVDEIS